MLFFIWVVQTPCLSVFFVVVDHSGERIHVEVQAAGQGEVEDINCHLLEERDKCAAKEKEICDLKQKIKTQDLEEEIVRLKVENDTFSDEMVMRSKAPKIFISVSMSESSLFFWVTKIYFYIKTVITFIKNRLILFWATQIYFYIKTLVTFEKKICTRCCEKNVFNYVNGWCRDFFFKFSMLIPLKDVIGIISKFFSWWSIIVKVLRLYHYLKH